MKKVFLSLAAIAFVAAGSLTVTSCGGDDSTPNPGNGGGGGGDDQPIVGSKLTFAGEEYQLDSTIIGVVGNSTNGPSTYNVDTDGDGTNDTVCTLWIIGSYEGSNYQNSQVGADYMIYVPVDGANIVYPHESSELYLAYADVWVDGDSVIGNDSEISSFDMTINAVDEENETIDYNASVGFTEGLATVDFNGYLDAYYYFNLTSGKGVKAKPVVGGKYVHTKVDLNNVKVGKLK